MPILPLIKAVTFRQHRRGSEAAPSRVSSQASLRSELYTTIRCRQCKGTGAGPPRPTGDLVAAMLVFLTLDHMCLREMPENFSAETPPTRHFSGPSAIRPGSVRPSGPDAEYNSADGSRSCDLLFPLGGPMF